MCIFCDIIDHKIPSKVVYEDDNVLAILDISQVTYGHTTETVKQCAEVISNLSKKIVHATKAAGCNILNNCGEVAGQTVHHLHFHIIPRYSVDDACQFIFNKSKPQDLEEVLKTIKGA